MEDFSNLSNDELELEIQKEEQAERRRRRVDEDYRRSLPLEERTDEDINDEIEGIENAQAFQNGDISEADYLAREQDRDRRWQEYQFAQMDDADRALVRRHWRARDAQTRKTPVIMPDGLEMDSAQFNTRLSPDEEDSFQEWKKKYAPRDSGADYDLRGAFKEGLRPDPKNGHWSDKFKKPNHPTFSTESQYARGEWRKYAGSWNNGQFMPSAYSRNNTMDESRRAELQRGLESRTVKGGWSDFADSIRFEDEDAQRSAIETYLKEHPAEMQIPGAKKDETEEAERRMNWIRQENEAIDTDEEAAKEAGLIGRKYNEQETRPLKFVAKDGKFYEESNPDRYIDLAGRGYFNVERDDGKFDAYRIEDLLEDGTIVLSPITGDSGVKNEGAERRTGNEKTMTLPQGVFDTLREQGKMKTRRDVFAQSSIGLQAEGRGGISGDTPSRWRTAAIRMTPFAGGIVGDESLREMQALTKLHEADYGTVEEAEKLLQESGWRPDENDSFDYDDINAYKREMSRHAEEEIARRTKNREWAQKEQQYSHKTTSDSILGGLLDSSGYMFEYMLPGAALGRLGKGATLAQRALRGAEMGIAPAARSAMSRYEKLNTADYATTRDGTLVKTFDAEDNALKPAVGAGVEAAVEIGTDAAIEAVLGLAGRAGMAIGRSLSKAPLVGGMMHSIGNFAKGSKAAAQRYAQKFMATRAGQIAMKTGAILNELRQSTGFSTDGLTEGLEEIVGQFADEALGLDKKSAEYKGFAKEWQDFENSTLSREGLTDIWLGLIGQMVVQGAVGGGAAAMSYASKDAQAARRNLRGALQAAGIDDATINSLTPKQQNYLAKAFQHFSANPDKLEKALRRAGWQLGEVGRNLVNQKGFRFTANLQERGVAPESFSARFKKDANGNDTDEWDFQPDSDGRQTMKDDVHHVSVERNADGSVTVTNDLRGNRHTILDGDMNAVRNAADAEVRQNQAMALDNEEKFQYLQGLRDKMFKGKNILVFDTEQALKNAMAAGLRNKGEYLGLRSMDDLFGADGHLGRVGRTGRAPGGFHLADIGDGTSAIVLILDNIESPADMARVLRHESGHGQSVKDKSALDVGFLSDSDPDSEFMQYREKILASLIKRVMTAETAETAETANDLLKRFYSKEGWTESFANWVQSRAHKPTWSQKREHAKREERRARGENLPKNDADWEAWIAEAEAANNTGDGVLNKVDFIPVDEAEGNDDEARDGADEAPEQPAEETGEPERGEAEESMEESSPRSEAPDAGVVEPPEADNGGQNPNAAGGDVVQQPMSESSFWNVMHRKGERRRVPVDSIRIPDTQFKENADPKTGVVKGQELGEYYENAENPIAIYERKDGTMEIVTGRHRLDAAKRSGWKDIDARIFREADGYTPEDMRLYDAVANILDEKGTVKDYVRFFDESGFSEEDAKSSGILNRQKGRMAFGIVQNATDDTRSAIDWDGAGTDGKITPEQAAIIADAAPKGSSKWADTLQKALVEDARKGKRGKAFELFARQMAQMMERTGGGVKAQSGEATQGDLFGGEEFENWRRTAEKTAQYRTEKAREYKETAEKLRLAMSRRVRGSFDMKPEAAKELGITDPNDRKQLAAAREKAVERANYWENAPALEDSDFQKMMEDLGEKPAKPTIAPESVSAEGADKPTPSDNKMARAKAAADRHVVMYGNGKKGTLADLISKGGARLHPEKGLTVFDKGKPHVVTIGFQQFAPTKDELPYLVQLQKDYDAAHPDDVPPSQNEEPPKNAPTSASSAEGTITPPKSADAPQGVESAENGTQAAWPKGWEHGKSLDGYAKATDADISGLKPGDEVAVAHTSGGSMNAKQAIFATVQTVGKEYDGAANADIFIGNYKDGVGNNQDARFKKSEIVGIKRGAPVRENRTTEKSSQVATPRKQTIVMPNADAAKEVRDALDVIDFDTPELSVDGRRFLEWAEKWKLDPSKKKYQREWAQKNHVNFDTPEFDPEKFGRLVTGVGNLVDKLTKYGYKDFKSLTTYIYEQDAAKYGRAKPVLQDIWNAVARARGLTRVSDAQADEVYAAIEKPQETAPAHEAPKAPPANKLKETRISDAADEIVALIERGQKFTRKDVTDIVERQLGGKVSNGDFDAKQVTDIMELAVNRFIAKGKSLYSPAANASADAAVRVIQRIRENILALIPTQTTRSIEQDKMQQFSTPPQEAFAAAWVANMNDGDVMLEPSAGIGGLAVFGANAGAKVITNELSPRRAEILEQLGIGKPFEHNAENLYAFLEPDIKAGKVKRPTVVVMNPPFSNSQRTDKKNTHIGADHVEQALKLLAPGGRLVAIVGNGMAHGKPAFKAWWDRIGREYTVRANIGINGQEYAKYGTTFDNNIIVIDKVAPNGSIAPIYGTIESLDELPALLEGVRNDRPTAKVDQSVQPAPSEQGGSRGVAPNGRNAGPVATARPATGASQGGVGGQNPAGRRDGRPVRPQAGNVAGLGAQDNQPDDGRGDGRGQPGEGGRANTSGLDVGRASAGPVQSEVATGSSEGLTVQSVEQTREVGDGTFSEYKPSKISIPGMKPHPTALVESSAMASVQPPNPTYSPKIPKKIIEDGVLSEAQIEQVVYAGQAHEQMLGNGERKGYFIGDGTGVGKGREISGVILDNFNNGRRKAVWVSKTSGLSNDAKRDLTPFGLAEELFTLETKNLKNLGARGHGVAFTTYSSLAKDHERIDEHGNVISSKHGKESRMQALVKWLERDFDGVIVFDESHLAGNAVPMKGKRGMTKPSAQALAVVDLQKALPKARILYVSATGATEVNNLAYATRLGLWGKGTAFKDRDAFISQVSNGGISVMEIVARDMKAMGVYMARTLSYEGIENERVTHELSPDQVKQYNLLAETWQMVMGEVESALISSNGIHGKANGNVKSAFWGAHQRFFNQTLTAMQMPTVLSKARELWEAGYSPVFQIVTTNEAAQNRAIQNSKDAGGEVDVENLDLSPRDILIGFVEQSFPTVQYVEQETDGGDTQWVPLTDANGNPVHDPAAVERKERLLGRLQRMKMGEAPLDMILNEFGHENVAEVTGRSARREMVRNSDGEMEMKIVRRTKNNAKQEADEFNDGKRTVLVFSGAGNTGFSFHADRKFGNQRRRVQFMIEAGYNAAAAIQGLGRTHRANESSHPLYMLCSTNLPGHKRFMSTIARRLAQLGSLTSGDRSSSGSGVFSESDNLENQYAKNAVLSIFEEMFMEDPAKFNRICTEMGFMKARVNSKTGEREYVNTLINEEGEFDAADKLDIPHFLNRILAMKIDAQNELFDEFSRRMADDIERAKENGTFDPGMEKLKGITVEVKNRTRLWEDAQKIGSTDIVEVGVTKRSRKTDYATAKERMSVAVADGAVPRVYTHNGSGDVLMMVETKQTRTMKDGSIVSLFRRLKPNGEVDYTTETAVEKNYTQVLRDEEGVWTKAYEATPDLIEQSRFFANGTLLPIWDRLGATNPRFFKVAPTGGAEMQTFLGMEIAPDNVENVLARFGKSVGAVEVTPDVQLRRVMKDGKRVELQNGWTLKRVKVLGDNRIEIDGVDEDADVLRLAQEPFAYTEKIGYLRVFLKPNAESMAQFLAEYPAVPDKGSLATASGTAQDLGGDKYKAPLKTFWSRIESATPADATALGDELRNFIVRLSSEQLGEVFDDYRALDDSELSAAHVIRRLALNELQARGALDWKRRQQAESESPRGDIVNFDTPGIYTGTAADYANRSRQGGVDDGPSLLKIGTGEGTQVYGWGLYGSDQRGVAETYMPRERTAEEKAHIAFLKRSIANETQPALKKYWEDQLRLAQHPQRNLYEQTFFTDRAPGDESHLLKWYEPVSKETWDIIREAERANGTLYNDNGTMLGLNQGYVLERDGKPVYPKVTGQTLYKTLAKELGSPKAASEFLARAGIDGVKTPVDSFGGKTVKDGDVAGWNYVSFRDDNIRVDHKWTNGVMQFDTPEISPADDAAYMDAVERGDTETAQRMVRIRANAKDAADARTGMPITIHVLHGTPNGGFTVFDPGMDRTSTGLMWASVGSETAETYMKGDSEWDEGPEQMYSLFARLENPVVLDAEGKTFSEFEGQIEMASAIDGYDGVIVKNIRDPKHWEELTPTTIVGVRNANQFKSADPVTYDDAGNVIPLSQRFNRESDDIRFDTPELTPAEAEYAVSEDKTPTEKVMREVYGMTNDEISTALRAAGMEPPAHARKTDEDMWKQAEALLSNPTYMAKLSRAVAKFLRPIRDYENAALSVLFRQREGVVNELEKRRAELAAIPEDDMKETPELADELKQVSAKLAQAKAQMAEAGKAMMQGASEQGRALRSNRVLIDQHDFTYAGISGQIAQVVGGAERITPEMDAQIREIAKLFEGLDAKGLRIATERLTLLAQKVIDQTKNGLKVRKATERKAGDEAKRVTRNYEDALNQIEVGAAEVGGTLIGMSDQQYPGWGKWLKAIGEFHCFENPNITEEECINAIVEDISPFVDADANQVRDILTGFGHNFKQSRYDSQRLMNDLKSQARLKRQLDWMDENNTMPPLTGMVRDEPSNVTRNLQKQVAERKKEVPDAGRDERRLKGVLDSAKTRVRNRIADLQRAIETGERIPASQRKVVEDLELRELKRQKEELQKAYDELFKTERTMTDAQRIALTEKLLAKELERALEDLDRARAGDFSKRPKRPGVESPTINVLRDRIAQTREQIRELKKAKYEFGMTPEEVAALNARKMANREKAVARLAERIATGDIRPQKKPQPPMTKDQQKQYDELGEQMKRGRQKLAELRLEAENATVPTFWRKAGNFLRFVTTAQRALRATMDFSAVLRQAARMTLAHPGKATQAFGKAWTAARSEASLQDVNDEILSDPLVQEAVDKYGLHLREVDATKARDVEMFHGMERNRIKLFGKEFAITDIPFFGGFMLKSERHYLTYLNAMSAEIYSSIVNDAQRFPGGATPWQKKMVADMINVWNGSAALSKERRQALQKAWVNNIFWAPQLAISRVQSAVGYDWWHPLAAKGIKNADGTFEKPSNKERVAVARAGLAQHLRSTVAMLAIGALLKWMFSDDDDKYNFSQADWFEKMMMLVSPKIGNTTIDLSGGESTFDRLVHQIATGRKRGSDGKMREISPWAALGRYLQGKASPTASTIGSLIEGKDYVGDEYGVGKMLQEMLLPLSFEDIKDQFEQNGIGLSLITVPLTLLGAGGSTYDRKPYENATNRFLEAKKEFDAISADTSIPVQERNAQLDSLRSSNPLMRDDVRNRIAAKIANLRSLESMARKLQKSGKSSNSLNANIEQKKKEILDMIRAAR